MKKNPIILLTTILIMLLFSCDKDTTGPEDEEFVVLSDNTIIIEETTLSEPIIDGTTYTYTFTGEPPDIAEGNVIIGQTEEGYLRKVTNATITENELILETDQACFTDAIEECNIIESYEFNLGGRNNNNMFNMYPVYLAKGVSIDRGRLSLNNTVLFSGNVNNADLTVEITEGSVNFEPSLNAELEISWFEIQHLLLSASGNLEFDCDLTLNCNAAVSYSDEITIATFNSPPFMFGPVPMILELSFVAGFEAELDITGEVTSGFDSNASVEFGAEYYNNNGWSTIWNNSSNTNAHSTYWGMNGDVYSKGYITPQLSLQIASVLGPYMEVETYLDFEGVINIPNWEWELAAGLNGNLGFEIEILSFTIVDYYTTLLNWEIVIANDSGEITNNPPEISSLTANPSSVEIGGTSTLICVASDPDGDNLTYIWETSGGSISGTGSSVTWTAPNAEGSYSVSCTVDDGNGGQDFESVNIEVISGSDLYFEDNFSTNTGWTNAHPQAYSITNGELHWSVERPNGVTEKFYRPTELVNPYLGDFRFQADFIITSTSPNCGFYSGLISSLNNGGSWFLDYAGIFIDISSYSGERRFSVIQTTESSSSYESEIIQINENIYYHADLQVVGQNYQLTVKEGTSVIGTVQGVLPYPITTYYYIGFGGPSDGQNGNISGKTDNLHVTDETTWDGRMD